MTNNLRVKLVLAILIIIGIFLLGKSLYQPEEKKVHFHAGFLVYKNNLLQDFSDLKYMHIEPCSDEGKSHNEDEQIEKAHLHDEVGDVVHVHREGAKWNDLFKNINYPLPRGGIKGYVNGSKVKDVLSYPINPYDSIIITLGDDSKIDLKQYMTRGHIEEIEKRSEKCGS